MGLSGYLTIGTIKQNVCGSDKNTKGSKRLKMVTFSMTNNQALYTMNSSVGFCMFLIYLKTVTLIVGQGH